MSVSRNIFLCTAALLIAAAAPAQTKPPQETRNAALRYWLAFAEMQDPPADAATISLLEKTAAGDAPWDEAKLGSILDQNEAAIVRMQRATKLPECDWGLEYSEGPTASIAYAPKARVLGRLNTLYGMRLAAQGDDQRAVDAWLAGVRFSQHVAQGGSLIFALIAKSWLLPDLRVMTQAAQTGRLSSAERKQIYAVVRALPESVFDWNSAWLQEENGLELGLDQMANAANPAERYAALMGTPAPQSFTLPTAADRATFHKLMVSAGDALRLPPDLARDKLASLHGELNSLHPFFQKNTPSFGRINDARAEIAVARQELLQALQPK